MKYFLLVFSFIASTTIYSQSYLMSNASVTTCSGSFYDSGGSGGTYAASQSFTKTFCPATVGSKMSFNFTAFDIESNFDFLYIYDGNSLKNISEKDGLQSNFVNQIIESKEGNYWISTTTGIFKYNGNTLTNITEKLIGNEGGIGCVFEDKKGTLWFSVNKRDIYSYNGKTFTKIKNKDSDFSPFPFQIYQDKQERLWFVGFKGAYRYENETFVNVTRIGPW